MDEELFQAFVNALAEGVQRELVARGIPLVASIDKGVKAARYVGRHSVGHEEIYQVTLTTHWPEHVEEIPAREFNYHFLRRWAIEMGIKLARRGILTTYEMELPRGVSAAAVGRADDLFLRCIMDYSLSEDLMVLRVDALAKWDE